MTKIPMKVASRLSDGVKKFGPIVATARTKDVGEADTVTIVKDFLSDALGYDKYSELTSEHAIRGTFCDLAVKIDGTLAWLIEVKSAGTELKEQHVKQAVDYAANQGCEWVVLTNATTWMVFRLSFAKPISSHLITTIDLTTIHPKKAEDLEVLWIISREGWKKSHLESFAEQKELLSKYTIASVLLSEPVVGIVRRELRRINADARIDEDDITDVLRASVIRRELLEGEEAERARRTVGRAANKSLRQTNSKEETDVRTVASSPTPQDAKAVDAVDAA